MTTGQLIKEARKKAGMTQMELAQKLKIPFQSVSQWEREIRNPKYETLRRIADALGVDWMELVPDGTQGQIISDHMTELISGSSSRGQPGADLLPAEFNDFEQFIESLGYYTRYNRDCGNYQLCKGKASVTITPEELQRLVRTSKATVAALVQDLMEPHLPQKSPQRGLRTANKGERTVHPLHLN